MTKEAMGDTRLSNSEAHSFVFIGFSTSLLVLFLLFFKSALIHSHILRIPSVIILAALVVFCLLGAAKANDFLITKKGQRVLSICVLAGAAAAPAILLFGDVAIFLLSLLLIFSAISISAAIIVWGMYLSTLTHTMLILFTSMAFILVGIFCVLIVNSHPLALAFLASVSFLVSWSCASILCKPLLNATDAVSSKLSKERNEVGKGNRVTLITIGYILGCAGSAINQIGLDDNTTVLVFGGSIVCAGFTMLVLRRTHEYWVEDLAKKSMSVLAALGLLLMPFVPLSGQAFCAGILLFTAVTNFIVLIDAVAETSRFNMISPVWLVGSEGFFCVAGGLGSAIVFWWGFSLSEWTYSIVAACLGSVLFCNVMQVFIAERAYPLLTVIDEDKGTEDHSDSSFMQGKAVWHAKLDVVATTHHLSPRQKEVMQLLVKGRDLKYIMKYFVVSHSTAKTHVYNLYKKLEIHSKQEMLDLIEQTVVTPEDVQNAQKQKEKEGHDFTSMSLIQ